MRVYPNLFQTSTPIKYIAILHKGLWEKEKRLSQTCWLYSHSLLDHARPLIATIQCPASRSSKWTILMLLCVKSGILRLSLQNLQYLIQSKMSYDLVTVLVIPNVKRDQKPFNHIKISLNYKLHHNKSIPSSPTLSNYFKRCTGQIRLYQNPNSY